MKTNREILQQIIEKEMSKGLVDIHATASPETREILSEESLCKELIEILLAPTEKDPSLF